MKVLYHLVKREEKGQALVLFSLALMVLIGFMAMSIDVGRYVWARTQMQAAVDAAALAAAQSMPSTLYAEEQADLYWLDNSGFIQSQGTNIAYGVSYPPGNKTVRVQASADIPTWFAKFFGVPKWTVSASGDAESQVLDIAVVLDSSGSMCLDSYPRIESGGSLYLISPGRYTPYGGFQFPRLAQPIPASTSSSIDIYLNDVGIFTSTSSYTNKQNFGNGWNSSTPYWNRYPGNNSSYRKGMIRIGTELFQITAVDESQDRLTVTRARQNNYLGVSTVQQAHAVNSEVWALRNGGAHGTSSGNDYCDAVSYYSASVGQNGPHQPFDAMISNAQYFTTLFDPAYDKLSIAEYASEGSIISNLSSSHGSVSSAMNNIIFPSGGTNIADGIAHGRMMLDGPGKRSNAVRVLVLLTDGVPTHYCPWGYDGNCGTPQSSGTPTSCPISNTTAVNHALEQAQIAADADILIFTIGLGDGVLDCFLEEIAEIGGGSYVAAPTTADLDEAFTTIAEQTHIALVK